MNYSVDTITDNVQVKEILLALEDIRRGSSKGDMLNKIAEKKALYHPTESAQEWLPFVYGAVNDYKNDGIDLQTACDTILEILREYEKRGPSI